MLYKKTNDPFEKKISLEDAKKEYDESFPERFTLALKACMESDEDALYIIGPSSYLFSLGGVKIAVDPQVRRASDLERVKDAILAYFPRLSAVLVSHEHDDHFCTPLARLVKHLDLCWYLPEGIRQRWVDESELREENIRLVKEGDILTLGGVKVKVFDSPHRPFGAEWDMPERGYELATERGRVLLPGDIREYAYESYPPLQGADICITHVWAGNDTIDEEKYLPMMEKAADFFARFRAKTYLFAHLYEIGREQIVMWDTSHANLLGERIRQRLPEAKALTPILGRGYRLFSLKEIE